MKSTKSNTPEEKAFCIKLDASLRLRFYRQIESGRGQTFIRRLLNMAITALEQNHNGEERGRIQDRLAQVILRYLPAGEHNEMMAREIAAAVMIEMDHQDPFTGRSRRDIMNFIMTFPES